MRWLWLACALGGCSGGCGGSQMVVPGIDGPVGPGSDGASDAGPRARPVCGGSITAESSCTGVDQLTLSDPQVKSLDGGPVVAGQPGTIAITATNHGTQAVAYPCVGFASDDARVTFTDSNPVFSDAFSIPPGASLSAMLGAQWGSSIPPGTVVQLTAWADVLHGGCAQGAELHWTVTVH